VAMFIVESELASGNLGPSQQRETSHGGRLYWQVLRKGVCALIGSRKNE
jgi:hypothetical protein